MKTLIIGLFLVFLSNCGAFRIVDLVECSYSGGRTQRICGKSYRRVIINSAHVLVASRKYDVPLNPDIKGQQEYCRIIMDNGMELLTEQTCESIF